MKYFLLYFLLFSSQNLLASIDCTKFLSNPLLSNVYETEQNLYFLMSDGAKSRDSVVIKMKLKDGTVKKLGNVQSNDLIPIVGHGSVDAALSLISFHNFKSGCLLGDAIGVGLWASGKKKGFNSFDRSTYSIIKTDKGNRLVDLKAGFIKEYEPVLRQRRLTIMLPKEGYPLYFSYKSGIYFYFDPVSRELVKYNQRKNKVIKKLRISSDMKLSQYESLFAIIKPAKEKHAVEIKWIDGWTSRGYKGFKISLPKKFNLDNSSIFLNLNSNTAVVYGKNNSERSILRSVLFIDIKKNKIIKEDFPAKNNYYSKIHFSPSKNKMYLASSPIAGKGQAVIQTYDFESGSFLQSFLK